MLNYEKLKKWFQDKDNKNKLVLGTCFILVFIVGYGTGNFNKEIQRKKNKTLNNYTTNRTFGATERVAGQGTINNNSNKALDSSKIKDPSNSKENCIIKGNISSSGMIYHIPGGSFYKRTNPEVCFKTEEEAKKAGFRKSSR